MVLAHEKAELNQLQMTGIHVRRDWRWAEKKCISDEN